MTRILIVDDQDDMRAGIRAMPTIDPGFLVAGDLSDGLQVLPFLRDHPVDLVLMDIRMAGIDGVEATRRIRKEHPPEKLRIIVLTTFDQDDIVLAALRAGANGFLSKTVSPVELVAGITEVVSGGGVLSATATAALIGHMTHAVRAMTKVGARDRAQLVSFTFRAGLYP
jgi:DNA-binding NarL/FixJ family response regulator